MLVHQLKGDSKRKRECQDSFCVIENFTEQAHFCGIFDGHGPLGKNASEDVSSYLQEYMDQNVGTLVTDINQVDQQLYFLKEAFRFARAKFKTSYDNYTQSGSCAIAVLIQHTNLMLANVGDSKAVIYEEHRIIEKKNGQVSMEKRAIELSQEHKPTLKKEKKRILESGGRIEKVVVNQRRMGPYRIWANENGPGLAMTRSFGDFDAQKIGTNSIPDTEIYQLSAEDQFMIVASDGLWALLTSNEACAFVKWYMDDPSTFDKDGVAEALVDYCVYLAEQSKLTQNQTQHTRVRDDITVIIVFFNFTSEPLPFATEGMTSKRRTGSSTRSAMNKTKIVKGKDVIRTTLDKLKVFQSNIPRSFINVSKEIKNLKGNKSMQLIIDSMCFGAGLAMVPIINTMVGQCKAFSKNTVTICKILPNLTGAIARIPVGNHIQNSGGKKGILITLSIIAVSCAVLALFPSFTNLATLQTSDSLFYIFVIVLLFGGVGIANFQLVTHIMFWNHNSKAGRTQNIVAGIGNSYTGIMAIILVYFLQSYSISTGAWLIFTLIMITLILTYLFMQNSIFHQLKAQKCSNKDCLYISQCIGQTTIPGTKTVLQVLIEPSTQVFMINYFLSFGGFLAVNSVLNTYNVSYHQLIAKDANLFAGIFSTAASFCRIATGYLTDIIGGFRSCQIACFIILLGSILMAFDTYKSSAYGIQIPAVGLLALGLGFLNAAVFKWISQVAILSLAPVSAICGAFGASGGFMMPPLLFTPIMAMDGNKPALSFLFITGLTFVCLLLNYFLEKKLKKEDIY